MEQFLLDEIKKNTEMLNIATSKEDITLYATRIAYAELLLYKARLQGLC